MSALESPEAPSQNPVDLWADAEVEPRAAGTVYKVAVLVPCDSTLPRDVMQVTPHLQDNNGTQSPAQIATTLATNMGTYMRSPSFGGTVKIYHEDFNPQAPHPPLATATFGNATSLTSSVPREIALCLSYYAAQNTKRFRGRLYIPWPWLAANNVTTLVPPGLRPTGAAQTAATNFYTQVLSPGLKANGVQWVVASHVDKAAKIVSNYWVDDEWDIVRRRGLRGLTRVTGVA